MSLLSRRARGPVERRRWSSAIPAPSSEGGKYAYRQVSADQAMRHSTVWACHDLLARTVATLPWQQFRSGEEVTPVTLSPLLASPSGTQSTTGWKYAVMSSLLLRGNAFGLITQVGRDGWPSKIELLHPDRVEVREDGGQWRYLLASGTRREELDPQLVWHVAAYDSPGSPVGLSPIGHAAASIALGLEAQSHGLDWFDRGAHPSALIYADAQLDAPTAQLIKDRVRASWRSGEPAVLGSGLKWEAVQVAPDESQFLETVNANASMVCQWFGVPPEMVGVATSGSAVTYANREQRAIDFLTFTLRPWLVRLEEALTRLTPRPYMVRFNTGALLKTDLKTRYESYAMALNAEQPWLTVDEVRRLEDRPPLAETSEELVDARGIAELIQRIYLGVGSVLTADEARDIANRAGAGLSVPGPFTAGGGA